jgi:hypothetical protein
MDFTFGIITTPQTNIFIESIIHSIVKQNIPNYEIIIIGTITPPENIDEKVIIIPFDESIYPGWITKKKNLITENAKYENIVFLHDYVGFDDGWYDGFLKFGSKFDVVSNIIHDMNGNRFRDWNINLHFMQGLILNNGARPHPIVGAWDEWIVDHGRHIPIDPVIYDPNRGTLLEYDADASKLQKYIYLSGAYWVAKKSVMQEFRLSENLLHCQGEDVEWCQRVREKYTYSFNPWSKVSLLKHR